MRPGDTVEKYFTRFAGIDTGFFPPQDRGRVIRVRGTVTYIHPESRYYTARFRFKGGDYQESFPLRGKLAEDNYLS